MKKHKPLADVSLQAFKEQRRQVELGMRNLKRSETMPMGKLVNLVQEVVGEPIKSYQIRHLFEHHIILPEPAKSADGNYRFAWKQVSDILLFFKLDPLPRPRRLALFHEEAEEKATKLWEARGEVTHGPPNQIKRAYMYWRSNLIMVFLASLFRGDVPREARIALRRNELATPHTEEDPPLFRFEPRRDYEKDAELTAKAPGDFHLITTRDQEVLHHDIHEDEWKGCYNDHGFTWYRLDLGGTSDSPAFCGLVVIRGSAQDDVKAINAQLLMLLLRAFFVTDKDIPPPADEKTSFSTRLQVLANLIPALLPRWGSCIVFVPDPDKAGSLVSVAVSHNAIQEGKTKELHVMSGELLAGWSYRENQVVVVEPKRFAGDPRVYEPFAAETQAAAAVPTDGTKGPNGVLFVGASLRGELSAFSETEILFLRILGGLLGNLIGLEHLRSRLRLSSMSIIGETPTTLGSWDDLRKDIERALQPLQANRAATRPGHSLYLVAVRITSFKPLAQRSHDLALWAKALIVDMSRRFCVEASLDMPTLFEGPSTDDEIVLLVDRIQLSDIEERDLRSRFREKLNTLVLGFDGGRDPMPLECELWSLPFDHAGLGDRIKDGSEQDVGGVAAEVHTTIARAFRTLTRIHLGHDFERRGNAEKALEQFELADAFDPENEYIRRHVAKALTSVYQFEKACGIWESLIKRDSHPSHLRRLAYNYACMNRLEEGKRTYEAALGQKSNDALAHEGLGDVLLEMEEYDEAVKHYVLASAHDEPHAATYHLRIARARLRAGDLVEARRACNLALSYNPDDSEARHLIVQISASMRKKLLAQSLE